MLNRNNNAPIQNWNAFDYLNKAKEINSDVETVGVTLHIKNKDTSNKMDKQPKRQNREHRVALIVVTPYKGALVEVL